MRDLSESEALDLVSGPLICEDAPGWTPINVQAGTVRLGAGVLDIDGTGTQMYIELMYRRSQKTNTTTFLFTLFKRYSYGKDRVYQLEVTQTPRRIKDQHKISHEHMGSTRTVGDAVWASWGYDEVLAYFSARTNIIFRPLPPHPEHFQLTGE
ncbi:hypothetical protein [Massilia sp. TWR1-2-2]|uniref:hypothetical protein n=1 Tax=Massilia sp. TWR1-2-2 TaxID=2804584 RepID=UPI003CE9F672